MGKSERFQGQFLKDMKDVLDASGLSERWRLDEKDTFIYGSEEEAVDGEEPFHWEYGVAVESLENPGESMEIYGYDEGTCSVDENGDYIPYTLNFKKEGFGVYSDGQEAEVEEGSDAAAFRDAFEVWLDFWYEDWYGENA
jgi:hypothetical protein